MPNLGWLTHSPLLFCSRTHSKYSIATHQIARWMTIVGTLTTRYLFCVCCRIDVNLDNQTVNTCLNVPRLDISCSLPISPRIVFQAVFVDGDKTSNKKGIFKSLKKDVKEVPDSLNGGSNVVVAPGKMKKRYLEVTLLTDALIICKVDTRFAKERRLLFPPIPLTEMAATVLPGHNNSIDVTLSAENILRLVELEAGQRDKFAEIFNRLKAAMATYKGIYLLCYAVS